MFGKSQWQRDHEKLCDERHSKTDKALEMLAAAIAEETKANGGRHSANIEKINGLNDKISGLKTWLLGGLVSILLTLLLTIAKWWLETHPPHP